MGEITLMADFAFLIVSKTRTGYVTQRFGTSLESISLYTHKTLGGVLTRKILVKK